MQIRRTMLSQNSDIRINRHKTMKIQNYENMSRESDYKEQPSKFEKQINIISKNRIQLKTKINDR